MIRHVSRCFLTVFALTVGCGTAQHPIDGPAPTSQATSQPQAEDPNTSSPTVVYWELPTEASVLPHLPPLAPVPDGFVEPREIPTWFRHALSGDHFFGQVGSSPPCTPWDVQSGHARSSFFMEGSRMIRHHYTIHVEDAAIRVISREEQRQVLHVQQVRVEFSGPDVEERDVNGRITAAESVRSIHTYSVVGGDTHTVLSVPSFGIVRAYDSNRTVSWFRSLEECEMHRAGTPHRTDLHK